MKKIITGAVLCITSLFAADPGGYISESINGSTLTIHPDRTVASLKISSSEYSSWKSGGFNNSKQRNAMSSKVYDYFKDDFDLIFFVLNETSTPSGLSNQLINTARDFSGMGITEFDSNTGSSPTGSDGNLKAYIQLTRIYNFKLGPVLHECMHMFGNFSLDDAEQASAEYGTTYHMQHWGYTGFSGPNGGELGGFALSTLQNLGGNNWQANDGLGHANFDGGSALSVNASPYSNFEMYLAGWYPKDSVGTTRVFKGITVDQTTWASGKFTANSYTDYTIDQLIASKGARTPGVATSQKKFRILTVVLTATDLSASTWNTVTSDVAWFTQQSSDGNSSLYNFWEATRGIATVDASGLYNSLKSSGTTTEYTITASVSGSGSISPSGSVTVAENGSQAFTIAANSGYQIDSVVVDGSNKGVVSNYSFTDVTANHTIKAWFSQIPTVSYTITASVSGSGSISPNGTVSVAENGSQVYTMSPNSGYLIDSVVVDGNNIGAVANYSFTNVTANHTILAWFSPIPANTYVISASVSGSGSISPNGTVSVAENGAQAFAIAANSGYQIDSVVVDGTNAGAVTSYNFTDVTANHTIKAWFSEVIVTPIALSDPSQNLIEWGYWEAYADTLCSSVDTGSALITSGTAAVSFAVAGSDSTADQWAYAVLGAAFPEDVANTMDQIDSLVIVYSSTSEFILTLPQPDLADDGASYGYSLPSTGGTVDTLFIAISDFAQPDWVADEPSLIRPYMPSEVKGVSLDISVPYVGGSGSIEVSELRFNHYMGTYGDATRLLKTITLKPGNNVIVQENRVLLTVASAQHGTVSLYRANGSLIREREQNFSAGVHTIDLSDIAPGFYMLRFSGTSAHFTRKFLIK